MQSKTVDIKNSEKIEVVIKKSKIIRSKWPEHQFIGLQKKYIC